MTLTIEDLKFNINSIILDGFIDEEDKKVYWGLEVLTNKNALNKNMPWSPKLTSETFYSTSPYAITSINDLNGVDIIQEEDDDEFASMYVFEHNPIYKSKISISSEEEGLMLHWKGICNINYNQQYNEALNFALKGLITFKGIWLGRENKDNSLIQFKNFFHTNDFLYSQTKNGVSKITF